MNQVWKNFLLDQHARFVSETEIEFPDIDVDVADRIYPIGTLGVVKIAGKDAAQFLQGQVTCNVNEVTQEKSSFGAYCNPKGRVITTFLLLKTDDGFLMVLPLALIETVVARLAKYILRADVKLIDASCDFCLLGVSTASKPSGRALPERHLSVWRDQAYWIRLPGSLPRFLVVGSAETMIDLCDDLLGSGDFQTSHSKEWCRLDIENKIPWLDEATCEEFIPQMLNIDQLGGISLNKGCYTGQEIVARTHYLGKVKRELFVARFDGEQVPPPNTSIVDESGQVVGKVLQAEYSSLLVVLPGSESMPQSLKLDTMTEDKVEIITL